MSFPRSGSERNPVCSIATRRAASETASRLMAEGIFLLPSDCRSGCSGTAKGHRVATQVGLDHEAVIQAAAELADERGVDALTLAALATRLGIRSQSLYAHVDGLDGLLRDLALHSVRLLGDELRVVGDRPLRSRRARRRRRRLLGVRGRSTPGATSRRSATPATTTSSPRPTSTPRKRSCGCCSRSAWTAPPRSTLTGRCGPASTGSSPSSTRACSGVLHRRVRAIRRMIAMYGDALERDHAAPDGRGRPTS